MNIIPAERLSGRTKSANTFWAESSAACCGVETSTLRSTGASAGPSNQDLPRQQLARSRSPAANTVRSKPQGKRGRFIDDQASGEQSPTSPPPSSTKRPGKHLMHRTHQSAQPMGQTSTSSDSDSPPAAKRHKSRSLQRQPSVSNDTSGFSNADTPAEAPGHHVAANRQKQRQQKNVSRQQTHGKTGSTSLPSSSCRNGPDSANAADRQKVESSAGNAHAAQSKAAGLPNTGAAQTNDGSTSNMLADAESEARAEGGGVPQEEEKEEAGSAFELPSQMPRELQSWAWDK